MESTQQSAQGIMGLANDYHKHFKIAFET